jgi:hypothetical protein
VRFSLPDARPAALEVMDVAGRRLVSRRLDAMDRGPHTLDLATTGGFSPGIYWVRLQHADHALTRKVCVIR